MDINYIGITNFRNEYQRFGIKEDDRRRHMYIIGKSGVGKTTMLENMARQDIMAGKGVGIIDPHGELINRLLHFIPAERIKDVVYFNPNDVEWPTAFNVIEHVPLELRHLVVAGLMAVFKKIWPDVWSSRMEYILNNTLLALLEYPDSTLLGVNRMLSDKDFRAQVLNYVTDVVIKSFWQKEFARYYDRYATEAIAPIQNKIGQFISNPLIRNIIGQKESKLNMRKIMDEKKIFLVNVSKGLIGEDNSMLLGALIITKLQLAAMSRVDIPEEQRQDFYLYIDEFQNFSTESFANIFAEARKYRLDLILAHQYIAQLDGKVRDSIFGNVGTLVAFRSGPEDAEFLEKYFTPDFNQEDLINLPNYSFYIKLMIDGVLSKGFSGINIPPTKLPSKSYVQDIIQYSRQHYSTPRQEVEKSIAHWEFLDFAPSTSKNGEGIKKGWETTCSRCGKKIIVPFRPIPGRPVYCKECLAIVRQEKEKHLTNREAPVATYSKSATSYSKKVTPKVKNIQDTIKNIFNKELKEKE